MALLLPIPAPIRAEEPPTPPVAGEQVNPKVNDWIVTLGSQLSIGPRYEGAGNLGLHGAPTNVSGIPSISWRRSEEPPEFSAPDDSLQYTLYNSGDFRFGPVLNIHGGRYHYGDESLHGLKILPWTLEAGAFAEYWPIHDTLRTRIELRQGVFHGHNGAISDVSSDLVHKIEKFTWSGGPRLSVADHNYMNYFFGVSDLDALRNGLVQPYLARAGVKSVGLATALSYEWSPKWTTAIFQRYDHLTGDAAESPIVRNLGQRNQYLVGASANYSFKFGL